MSRGRGDLRRRPFEHGERAGDVEAAHADRDAGLQERPRDVERARELVRLHADQAEHAAPAVAPGSCSISLSGRTRQLVSSIAWMRISTSAPSTLRSSAVLGEAVHAGERIRRNDRAPPLQRIAVVVVMRRLDQDEVENLASAALRWPFPPSRLTSRKPSLCMIFAPAWPAGTSPNCGAIGHNQPWERR